MDYFNYVDDSLCVESVPLEQLAKSRISASSPSDSTLKLRMPTSKPRRISSASFPTPEKTILLGTTPASKARSISPTETTSAPKP